MESITIYEHHGRLHMMDWHKFNDSEQILHTNLSDIELQAISKATPEQVQIILRNYIDWLPNF